MWLLHPRFSERGSGSAGTSCEEASGTSGSREAHCRGARWAPVPLHRLHQISPGPARRDSRRSRTLSLAGLASWIAINREGLAALRWWRCMGERKPTMNCEMPLKVLVALVALFIGTLATDTVSDQSDSLASP